MSPLYVPGSSVSTRRWSEERRERDAELQRRESMWCERESIKGILLQQIQLHSTPILGNSGGKSPHVFIGFVPCHQGLQKASIAHHALLCLLSYCVSPSHYHYILIGLFPLSTCTLYWSPSCCLKGCSLVTLSVSLHLTLWEFEWLLSCLSVQPQKL